jgi:hypothetical protein
MKKEEKKATQEETPAVVNTQENTTPVEKIEVVGTEEVNSDSAKPEENNTDQNTETESRVIGVKVVTDEDNIETQEASILEPLSFIAESGEEYQITVPKFRFKGQEYDSQKAIDETPEVLEILIDAKSFIIKKA